MGTLCVLDQKTYRFTEEQENALKALDNKQVVDKIELRRKVATREKSNQELINANALIQKFASMAAHDIKKKLSSIKLTSQALKMRHEKAKDEACLGLVNLNINAADNLLELVNEMLAYSKTRRYYWKENRILIRLDRFSTYAPIRKYRGTGR